MAKEDEKNVLGGIFDATEEPKKKRKPRPKKDDPMVPFSVSIRKSEAEEFLKTIEKTGFSRSEIGRYAIKYFIKQWNDGKIELQTVKVEKETLQVP
jgi:hypothetical protein